MGSICSAVIVCRLFNLPDPREGGSKNPGATNVLRLAGKQYAAIVLLVDFIKGLLPVLLASYLEASPQVISFTVLAAVLGHVYPIFFDYRGGKGVATAMGALMGYQFIVGVMVAVTWLLVVKFTRYSSLASLISITLSPLYSLLLIHTLSTFPALFFLAVLILYKHRNNIIRLMDGTEPKVFVKDNVIQQIMQESQPISREEEHLKVTQKASVGEGKNASIKKAPRKKEDALSEKAAALTKKTTTKMAKNTPSKANKKPSVKKNKTQPDD